MAEWPPFRAEPLPKQTQWARWKWNWPYALVLLLTVSQWLGDRGWDVNYFSVIADVALALMSLTLVFIIQRQRRRIGLLAVTDKLTGLFNSNYLQTELNRFVALAHRTQTSLSVILMDLDNLKPVNDQFGHQAGNRLLFDFGQMLLKCVRRNMDICFRFGGDEFLVLCPLSDIAQARAVAERICKTAHELPDLKNKGITVSLGVAQLQQGETSRELFRRADTALYEAKNAGKDRVSIRGDALNLST